MTIQIDAKGVRFHNALLAFRVLAQHPDAALEAANAVPNEVVDAMENGIHKIADFLKTENASDFANAPALAKTIEAWVSPVGGANGGLHIPDRPTRIRWKKIVRGDSRVWTANCEGMALRVERKKTGNGTFFDAFVNDEYQLRSKSSVTARDRVAMEAVHKLAA